MGLSRTLPKLDFGNVSVELKQLGDQFNVDTWVVVSPGKHNSPVLFRDLFVVGAGTVRELTAIGRRAAFFSGIEVSVVTAASGELLASTQVFNWEDLDVAVWEQANKPAEAAKLEALATSVRELLGTQTKKFVGYLLTPTKP